MIGNQAFCDGGGDGGKLIILPHGLPIDLQSRLMIHLNWLMLPFYII